MDEELDLDDSQYEDDYVEGPNSMLQTQTKMVFSDAPILEENQSQRADGYKKRGSMNMNMTHTTYKHGPVSLRSSRYE